MLWSDAQLEPLSLFLCMPTGAIACFSRPVQVENGSTRCYCSFPAYRILFRVRGI